MNPGTEIIQQFYDAFKKSDVENISRTLSANVEITDPFNPTIRGKSNAVAFFHTFFNSLKEIRVELGPSANDGNTFFCAFELHGKDKGKDVSVRGVDVFRLDEKGLILSLEAFLSEVGHAS